MSWGPLRPARIDWLAGAPTAASAAAAAGSAIHGLAQARQQLLAGNRLPQRWAGSARFSILDTGFGLGHGFLATREAWLRQGRPGARLNYIAIAQHPPSRHDLTCAHAGTPLGTLATELIAHWPPLTPDLHLLSLDQGRVRLLLALGEVGTVLPELVAGIDAFFLSDAAADANAKPARWDRWQMRQLSRLAAPGATLVSGQCDAVFRQALSAAGFHSAAAGDGPQAFTAARYAPRFTHPPPAGREPLARSVPSAPHGSAAPHIAVIGAGLAGAAVAQALAEQGCTVQVFERQLAIASETSGQAGGLFHGSLHADDGPHARWLRVAALHASRQLRPLVHSGALPGAVQGLLRGEQRLAADQMQALLTRQALPADYLQVRRGGGSGGRDAAWFYPDGGWVDPAAWCRWALASGGITTHLGIAVQHLRQVPDGWQLLDDQGTCLQQVAAVVLCNAGDATRLLAPWGAGAWPLRRVRGQTTLLPAHWPGLAPLPDLPWPLADSGYALRLADGRLLCGASSQPDDRHDGLRDEDHLQNLATLQRLSGWAAQVPAAALHGRVGWRLQSDDRLPLLGPLPLPFASAAAGRHDQARLLPRVPGLYVFTALGSRGIGQAALAAQTLAAWLSGDALPLPATLLDALDVARWASRAARRHAAR